MRIAMHQLRGLGDPPGPTPFAVIDSVMATERLGGPSAPTPDQLSSSLAQQVQSTCTTWPEQCPGGPASASAAIAAAVSEYNTIWAAKVKAAADFNASQLQYCDVTAAEGNQYAYLCPAGTRARSAPFTAPIQTGPVTGGAAPVVYTVAPAVAPQTSAAPQATQLTPAQILPASQVSQQSQSQPSTSTDYLAAVKAWLAGSTYGFPNTLLVVAALGVGFYFYSKRGTR
jgi:hypothetical protein